jgi:hypothetical protein
MRYCQRDNLTVQSVDDETLILDIDGNQIHQLNSTASFIWESCANTISIEQLTELIVERYGVEAATAKTDVEGVIRQLSAMGLIISV